MRKRRIIATIAVATAITAGVNYLASSDVGVSGMANPDITEANKDQTICNPNWSTKSIRPPVSYTNKLKLKQIEHYSNKNPSDYEEDHAISLILAGHPTSPNNLWPQLYEPKPGAREKDIVENFLHRQVCGGALTLQDAQYQVLHWRKVYDKLKNNLGSIGVDNIDEDDQ